MSVSTVNKEEIDKFEKIADQWWDPLGKFKPLHMLNPLRLEFIIDKINEFLPHKNKENIKILDVGCGGGLVSEPLAKNAYDVVGLDASNLNIEVAKAHKDEGITNLRYICNSVEEYEKQGEKFDVVLALEIIEHVDSIELFLKSCTNMLNKDGILFISTINRNVKSFLKAILIAEYLINWVPRGTHDWNKFLLPSEISKLLGSYNVKPLAINGIDYDPIKRNWFISDKPEVNYIMAFK